MTVALPSLLVSTVTHLNGKPTVFDHVDVPTKHLFSYACVSSLFSVLVKAPTIFPSHVHLGPDSMHSSSLSCLLSKPQAPHSPCMLYHSSWGWRAGEANKLLNIAPKVCLPLLCSPTSGLPDRPLGVGGSHHRNSVLTAQNEPAPRGLRLN